MTLRSRRLAILGLLLVVFGCGGDAKVEVSTGGPGNNTGPRVSGLVLLPNGDLSQSTHPLYRFAAILVAEARALIAPNVEPAGRNVVVTLYRVDSGDIVSGEIRTRTELFQNSTDDEGMYNVVLPSGGNAETCRFMVQVGDTDDRTVTRAFIFSTSDPIDISFESEATVRLILETIRTGQADLCDFSAGDIRNIYRAVVESPEIVFGDDVAELNAAATAAARQDPRVQAAIAAAIGEGPTVPPRPTDTRGPTEPPPATRTNTQRPPSTATQGPGFTNTAAPFTSTPTERPTRTSTATRTRTLMPGEPTHTAAPPTRTSVPPTRTVPPPTRTSVPPTSTVPANTRTSTPTRTLGVPTGTATATQTSVPTATNTPMTGGPPLGRQECGLTDTSVIRLFTGFLARDLESAGTLEFECGAPDGDGVAECSCGVVDFEPINVPGIGFACLTPAMSPCTPGKIACDGGEFVGVDIVGSHDRDRSCTSNPDCDSQCEQICGSPTQVVASFCEGFCTAGTQESCRLDADCLPDNGSCSGKDGVPLGNVCQCTCVDDTGPASRPGGLQCQLAFNLIVEAATANPPNCDGEGDRPLIDAGDACAPMSTESVSAILNDAEGVPGATVPSTGPYEDTGTPITCDAFRQGTSGLETRGAAIFYGSTIGDLVTGIIAGCE